MSHVSYEFIIIVLLVIINGIFAMSEAALLSARRVRLQHRAERGDAKARSAIELLQDPNNFLSSVQIGVTLVGVLSGAFGGATIAEQIANSLQKYPSLSRYAESLGIAVVVLVITYLSLVIGELVPKRLALHSPERIAGSVAKPMILVSRICAPMVALLSVSTNALLWLLRVRESNSPAVTEDDVRGLVRMGAQTGVFEQDEQHLVERVFRFADRKVTAIMTHRANIDWLNLSDPPALLREEIKRSPHSRLPACDGDLDHTVGILVARDYWAAENGANLRELLKPPVFVPEGMPALRVLEQFRNSSVHVALVVDEYGGMQGMVSATDILEALVGDLPGDQPAEQAIVQRADGSWLIAGSLPIEDLKELLKLDTVPDEGTGRFQTAAGFVINHLRRIPRPSDGFEFAGVHIEVVDMDGNRVDTLLVERRDPGARSITAS